MTATSTSPVPSPTRTLRADRLHAEVYRTRDDMGRAAGRYVVGHIERLLDERRGEVRIVVGSAPSQDEFFAALTSPEARDRVDWSRLVVFHMDEYIGLPADHPQTFRAYQREHLLSKVDVGTFHEIHGEAEDPTAECCRLTGLITAAPIDLICLGIGENGHLAFNDPPAPFDDPEWVKIVELDAACRQQQVNDGCFPSVPDVPTHAITLTLRVFREAARLSCVVPGPRKANAVTATIQGAITEHVPATIMRQHIDARLFIDEDAASKLTNANP